VPSDRAVDATSAAGTAVSYVASATDNLDPDPSIGCGPASGSVFAIGTTTVTCTATDDAGNSASASFAVTVRGADDQIVRLIDKTLAFLERPSLQPTLRTRLEAAAKALVNNNRPAACAALNLYKAAVSIAPARALASTEKAELMADANRIRAVIGC
jgi:HYR domain